KGNGRVAGADARFMTDADTTPPSIPSGLTISGQATPSLTLSWGASTDPDSPVAGYHIYLNGSKVGTTTSTSYTYSGLACGTSYTLAVDAYDAAGNVSIRASLQSSTAPCSLITGPTIETLLYGTQGGAYGEGAWPGG